MSSQLIRFDFLYLSADFERKMSAIFQQWQIHYRASAS